MIRLGDYHKAKRMIGLLVAVIIILTLPACSRSVEEQATPTELPTQEITQTATLTVTPTPEPERPYKGDGSKYVYFTTDERDRKWEEDIVSFADTFLDRDSGHPRLIERGCEIVYLNDMQNGYEDTEEQYESRYVPELREEFIDRINRLLLSISEKEDYELRLGCAEAVAIINDAHTALSLFSDNEIYRTFPLELIPIYKEGVPEAYITAAPKGMEDLLLCRLDAINGVPVSEIIERFMTLISHENRYWVYYYVFFSDTTLHQSFIMLNNEILRYLGIKDESETALFSVTDETGVSRNVELAWYTDNEYPDMVVYEPPEEADESIQINHKTTDEDYAWYRIINEDKVLYIRIMKCRTDICNVVEEAIWKAQKTDSVKMVILDFRGNTGGEDAGRGRIVKAVDSFEAPNGKYVLIDGGACSASVSISVAMKRFSDGVVLVGAPAGMQVNDVFPRGSFSTPNGNISGGIAQTTCYYMWPGYEYDALMPDITVYQTLEDYKNGIDSVLKYLIGDKNE